MAFVATSVPPVQSRAHGRANSRRPRAPSYRMSAKPTRRSFLTAAALALCIPGRLAAAEHLSTESAVAVLQDARTSLEALSAAAELGEYTSLRVSLRTGSLGRIRAAGSALAGAEPKRVAAYRRVVSAVEQLDSHALRAERGGDRAVVTGDVLRAVQSVDAFLVAQEG